MREYIQAGQTFGRWTVLQDEEVIDGRRKCLCECSCPKHTVRYVEKFNLLRGRTMGCGCGISESAKKNFTTHGKTKSRLYAVWSSMKARCYNENNKHYLNYGGRGITVCEEWKDNFEAFEAWAFAAGYDENAAYKECTIDRIDVNGSYCPENCRWVSAKEQNDNRTTTIYLTYNNKTQTLLEWAKELGIPAKRMRRRYEEGLPIAKVMFAGELEKRESMMITYQNETHTLDEWAKLTGINKNTLNTRLRRGYPLDKVFTRGRL